MKNSLHSIINQRHFMDNVYIKCKMNSLDDFLQLTRRNIRDMGGKTLIYYYSNNLEKLYSTLYPYYPFNFKSLKKYAKDITHDGRLRLIEQLYNKFEFTSIEEWVNTPKLKIIKNGGRNLLSFYSNDIVQMLTSLYPNYPWISLINAKKSAKELTISYQREYMDGVFKDFNLTDFEEWYCISRRKIIIHGGKKIISKYNGDMKLLLAAVYPNYPWKLVKIPFTSYHYFKSIDNQRQFLDQLFAKFEFNSLEEFRGVSRKKLIQHRGKYLLLNYSNDYMLLLRTVYPHYPWANIDQSSIEATQLKKMQEIFRKLKLKELNDWTKISRMAFIRRGAKKILDYYSNDLEKLLTTLYPHYNFNFHDYPLRFRPRQSYFQSWEFCSKKLKVLLQKYRIKQKKDWYRLNIRTDELNVYSALKLIFPLEKWEKDLFQMKSKRTNQRQLLIVTQQLYENHPIFENYHHPQIVSLSALEFDLYIPSLNMAIEYQGECHFEDTGYNYSVLHHDRDQKKEKLAQMHSINLILIPFWWDQSPSSFFATIFQRLIK